MARRAKKSLQRYTNSVPPAQSHLRATLSVDKSMRPYFIQCFSRMIIVCIRILPNNMPYTESVAADESAQMQSDVGDTLSVNQ